GRAERLLRDQARHGVDQARYGIRSRGHADRVDDVPTRGIATREFHGALGAADGDARDVLWRHLDETLRFLRPLGLGPVHYEDVADDEGQRDGEGGGDARAHNRRLRMYTELPSTSSTSGTPTTLVKNSHRC